MRCLDIRNKDNETALSLAGYAGQQTMEILKEAGATH
jgi:hypothetical protein